MNGPYASIAGVGSELPARQVDNHHFAKYLDTSDEWIRKRTGIVRRHLADKDAKLCDLARPAAQKAIAAAGVTADQIDAIIVATTTPDRIFPATACLLQDALGVQGCPAFDVQAVCCGFLYALSCGEAMIRAERSSCALIVGADIFSRLVDWNDRSTCILFGDGAAAVVLKAAANPGIVALQLGAQGSSADILTAEGHPQRGEFCGKPVTRMDGQSVFTLATRAMIESSLAVCDQAAIKPDEIDWFVPHQANQRIISAVAQRLGIGKEKVVATIAEHGNTSAASIPLALDSIGKQIKSGDRVLMCAAGGGLTWGAALALMP